ncbi:hypothetical protein GCM10029964_050990 [Kibdelosporangium lantanae]
MTTPERIVDIAIGYMGAKQLFAASRIGLFRALAEGDRSTTELAEATGVDERMVRILADAMNAQGILDRDNGRYALAAEAGDHVNDLEPFLTFLNEISYGHWLQFDTTVDTAKPGDLKMDDGRWATFMAGVMRYNALHAAMLARTFDFTPYRAMLDLGGLSPEFAIGALRDNPDLTVRFVFAPMATDGITDALAKAGFTDRATIEPAATETAKPRGDHDIVMLNHVIHRFAPDQNQTILTNARAAANPGATLLLLDFFLDSDKRQRKIDALHAGSTSSSTAPWSTRKPTYVTGSPPPDGDPRTSWRCPAARG